MSFRATVRHHLERTLGLLQRGVISLRTRGVRASWQRVAALLGTRHAAARTLYAPAADAGVPAAVPASDSPEISVVIPVHGQLSCTLACLHALAAHPPARAIEVIVVDDASPDASASTLAGIRGLRLHRRAANGGFVDAANDGAALARGRMIAFLNNDTVPQPGWLDALAGTFDTHPRCGLAGAQLLYPDGRLQDAGGVVFADGSAESYGRFDDPTQPAFGFVRDADYLSGAALLLPTALFRDIGGFASCYRPGYYEDTDLAFAVRERGLRVLYQPAARVVHMEGASAGTDPARGMKAAQARHRVLFAQRRREALVRHPAAGTRITSANIVRTRPQVLVVDAITPAPDRDSGSRRLLALMQLLQNEGAHVVFWPANRAHAGTDTERLQALGIEVWHAPGPRAPAWLRAHGSRFTSALLCRHYVAREFLPLIRVHAAQARLVFDTVDLHHLREMRAAELHGDAALLRSAERTRELELDLVRRCDATLVVSEVERALLADAVPAARVAVLSNLIEVATPGPGHAARRDLLFVGGFRHPPNVDAMRWFVAEVWPHVRAARPALHLHVVGADAPVELLALAEVPGVQLHGHVADLAPLLAAARISIAPLRYGAGVKGKVNEAMAHGLPVVATACAVEAMHLADGEDVRVADTPEAFAAAILQLDADPVLWQRISEQARLSVQRHFGVEVARPVARQVLLGLAE